jgi:hypothetical protein
MNIAQATYLLHRYGNVGRTENDLLTKPPSVEQLSAAVARVKQAAVEAEVVMNNHFARKTERVVAAITVLKANGYKVEKI